MGADRRRRPPSGSRAASGRHTGANPHATLTVTYREIVVEREVFELDEDAGSARDEIKVEVILEPLLPACTSGLTNRLLLAA